MVLLVHWAWMQLLGAVYAVPLNLPLLLCALLWPLWDIGFALKLSHPDGLTAFMACRLIPLDKQPGVQPIGIGEVPQRIVAKAVLRLVDLDIREAYGSLQVCAGCEAAVHAVRQLYRDPGSQAVLLVDASNAFNSVNRQAALHNFLRLCPPLARILINTYQSPVRLIIPGSGGLVSTEGTTQGDPLAIAMYALAVLPLIHRLRSAHPAVSQVWYADDATGFGTCSSLRKWWDTLSKLGPLFGYNPNAVKTYLVVKPKYVAAAGRSFAGTCITVTTDGQRHLGTAIGPREYTTTYVTSKIKGWCDEIKRLSEIADIYPHAAYAAFTHGLFGHWSYIMRTIPDIQDLLQPLEDTIHQHLIPALFGRPPCSSVERSRLAIVCSSSTTWWLGSSESLQSFTPQFQGLRTINFSTCCSDYCTMCISSC